MKKDTSVRNDVAMMHKRADNQSKVVQIYRRLTAYIMAAVGGVSGALKRMDEVANATFAKRDINRQVNDGFWQHFVKNLFDAEQIGLFFRFFAKSVDGGEIRDPARNRVVIEFYRTAGESLDFSIRFGLQLLEEYGVTMEAFFKHQGFSEKWISHGVGIHALRMLQASANAFPHAAFPQRNWFVRLIHAAAAGNEAADGVLVHAMTVLTEHSTNMTMTTAIVDPRSLPDRFSLDTVREFMERNSNPTMCLSQEENRAVDVWHVSVRVRNARRKAAGAKVLDWVATHRQEFDAAILMRHQAITHSPRRGLRPGGADCVEIMVAPVYNAGVRMVSLVPDGRMYPNIGVDVMVEKTSPHLITFNAEMANFGLMLDDNALVNFAHTVPEVRDILEFVVLDAVYRLVSAPTKASSGSRSHGASEERDGLGIHPVRPHLRKLLPGQQASDDALSAASADMGWKLPPGVTFVRAHYRGDPTGGGHLEHELAHAPVMTYTDDDFFEALGV